MRFFRAQVPDYQNVEPHHFRHDASRMLYRTTIKESGAYQHEGYTSEEILCGELVSIRRILFRLRSRDRNNQRYWDGRPDCRVEELYQPNDSVAYFTVAATLVASNPPKQMGSAFIRAYKALRRSFVPRTDSLIAPVDWGNEDLLELRKEALTIFELIKRNAPGWRAKLYSLKNKIENQMQSVQSKPTAQASKRGFNLIRVGELEYKPPEYIIDTLVENDCLSMIFGDPACGKSFVAVGMAASVASGHPFHGMVVMQGPAIYIAGEGRSGLLRRFDA